MEITEVRIKLMDETSDRLRAFCSITFDDSFVVRDLKIIEGASGPFVAMPSRKLTAHCPQCRCKNHLRATYCNQCGLQMKSDPAIKDQEGRTKLYADIAHPINSDCREMIQDRVIEEFQKEQGRANEPGYRSTYDEFFSEDIEAEPAEPVKVKQSAMPPSLDTPHIEPAEHGPRAPHTVPSRQAENQPRGVSQKTGHFGAGIFDSQDS